MQNRHPASRGNGCIHCGICHQQQTRGLLGIRGTQSQNPFGRGKQASDRIGVFIRALSAYTKGTTALLAAIVAAADVLGVRDDLYPSRPHTARAPRHRSSVQVAGV